MTTLHSSKLRLWELPLAIASWLFFRMMKFIIGNLYTLFLLTNRQKAKQWRVFSPEVLNAALSLPVLMTKGPRWNTHAIIGTVGPIKVNSSLGLALETIAASAESWTAAIYSYPGYRTVGNLGSLQVKNPESDWETINLAPGYYTIGLRYYGHSDNISMPQVQIDNVEVVPSQSVDSSVNDVYKTLRERENWFYRALHYYVFTLLQCNQWLPTSWIRSEFLPVGAPETHFEYGAIAQSECMTITLATPLIQHYNIYLTHYNRASFPTDWIQIQQDYYRSAPMAQDGFYLFRIRPKNPTSPAFNPEWLNFEVS